MDKLRNAVHKVSKTATAQAHIHNVPPDPQTRSSADNQRPSILKHHPMIAFIPENFNVPDEMIELEEKLEEADHHHKSDPHPKPVHTRESILSRESLIVPQGQHVHPLLKSSKIFGEKFGDEEFAYEWLPRPFRKHWKDIEKRRARKIIDIMNSSHEEFVFTDKDRRIRCAPSGTLVFHVLELFNLSVNETTYISTLPVSFYCVLTMGPIKRCSKIVHSLSSRRIRVDYTVNFSVELSEWRESPLNRFYLELWSFQDPEIQYIVGTMEIHAYDFIRKQHTIEIKQLWSDGIKMGKIAFEYAFTYGYFGFGHSNQLKNPKNPIMETVCHSMYPRIRLEGNDIKDKVYKVRMPDKLKLFTYDSVILELDTSFPAQEGQPPKKKHGDELDDLEPKPVTVQQVEFEDEKPIHCRLHMNIWQKEIQSDFNDAYGEFVCIGNRRNRLDHLTNLVQGRMRDIRETEAGWLFRPLKERDVDKINRTEQINLGYIIHPQRIPCPTGQGQAELTKDDEKFQDDFPAVRRGPGYLATLFGFEKKPEPSECLNDMDYPLYKEANPKKRKNIISSIRKFFMRLWAYINLLYNFVFPEIRKESIIPEVSVTTPTPEGSTTNIFTYFIRDQRDPNLNKVERLQVQAGALIDITEKPQGDLIEDDSDSSSSSEGDNNSKKRKKKSRPSSVRRSVRRSMAPRGTLTENTSGPPAPFRGLIPAVTTEGGHRFKAGLNQPTFLYKN